MDSKTERVRTEKEHWAGGFLRGLVIIALACLPVIATAGAAPSGQGPYRVRLYPADYLKELRELNALGYDIAGVNVGISADVIVNAAQLHELEAKAFAYEILADGQSEGSLDPRYKDPDAVERDLMQRQATHPLLFQRVAIGVTAEGRTIWAAKISSDVTENQDKPSVLFDAMHHAREVMTPEIAIDIIDHLLDHYDNPDRPWVKGWVDNLAIWVVPMVNPDGNAHVWNACRWTRKNRRDCGEPEQGCELLSGTDPNRNYDYNWGLVGCGGSDSRCFSEVHRGQAPWQEESAALRNLALQIRPVFNVSFHSFGELVIYPYGCTGRAAEEATLREMAGAIGGLIPRDGGGTGYRVGRAMEVLYPVDGSSIDWMYAQLGTLSFVIEVNSDRLGFQPAYDPWQTWTAQALRPVDAQGRRGGWSVVLDRVFQGPSIVGHIYNAQDREPLSDVTIAVDEIVFTQGEAARVSNRFGRYQWFLMPGTYHVTFAKPGFAPQTLEIRVKDAPVENNIFLDPI